MDLVKVKGVTDWPEPKNHQGVQSFLGFVNFYRCFIQDFSHHAWALFDLTKKDTKWEWGPKEQATFDKLKTLITTAPILTMPWDSAHFRVKANSSDFTTGATHSQLIPEDGRWHTVTFLSKSFSLVEWNYEIHDKEMLTIIWALDEW